MTAPPVVSERRIGNTYATRRSGGTAYAGRMLIAYELRAVPSRDKLNARIVGMFADDMAARHHAG